MKTVFLVYKAYSPFASVETEINSHSVDSPHSIFKVSFQWQEKYNKAMLSVGAWHAN